MDKLYPPYISGTLPAFTGTELTIPFQMNQTVSAAEVSGFAYIFKTIQSNVVIAQGQIVSPQAQDAINSGSITFQLKFKQINGNAFQLNLGQFYKVQLAYIDNNGVIGYYSTVGIAKYTTDPKVEIEGLESGGIGINKTNFVGHYSQYKGDVTERVYSYQFIVYDEYHNIFATSGEQLHNTINDEQLYESYDSFELNKELIKGKNYYIQYKVTTINNYEAASPEYRIINRETIDPEIRATLQAVMDENNGFAQINLKGIKDAATKSEIPTTGAFILLRASSEDNYSSWNPILKFKLTGEAPSRILYKDFTVEHGFSYQYAIQQYSDATSLRSNKILSNIIYSIFEDSFLYESGRLLKIRFNPKVESFKINTLETKMDTIGSQYPYIFRNGNTYYHEFPIGGLISYLQDESHLFINKLGNDEIKDFTSTDLTDYNYNIERQFKTKVLEFLTNGKPKLFKSPAEGNFIVRLLNVTLTPQDTLGRMLHSFKGTAYEIDKVTFDNLNSYGFVDADEPNSEILKWNSLSLYGIYKLNSCLKSYNDCVDRLTTETNTESINKLNQTKKELEVDIESLLATYPFYKVENDSLNPTHKRLYTENLIFNGPAVTLRLQGFSAGDKFKINNEEVVIGVTGAYLIDHSMPVYTLEIVNISDQGIQQGTIEYSFMGTQESKFDIIEDVKIADLPLEQCYSVNGGNILDQYQDDLKYTVLKIYFMRFTKRELQTIYTLDGKKFYLSPGGAREQKSDDLLTSFDRSLIYKVYNLSTEMNNPPVDSVPYFYDGNTQKPITYNGRLITEDEWDYKIRFNNDDRELIDITHKNEYFVTDLSDIISVEIDPGILCELSIQRQEKVFSFENDNITKYKVFTNNTYVEKTIYQLKTEWQKAYNDLQVYQGLIRGEDDNSEDGVYMLPFTPNSINASLYESQLKTYNSMIKTKQADVDNKYNLFIKYLKEAINNYEIPIES